MALRLCQRPSHAKLWTILEVASASTVQWLIKRARAPANMNALARPDRGSAPGVPSADAVLQAISMTQSASRLSSETSLAKSRALEAISGSWQPLVGEKTSLHERLLAGSPKSAPTRVRPGSAEGRRQRKMRSKREAKMPNQTMKSINPARRAACAGVITPIR
jgi:hypothetical protein